MKSSRYSRVVRYHMLFTFLWAVCTYSSLAMYEGAPLWLKLSFWFSAGMHVWHSLRLIYMLTSFKEFEKYLHETQNSNDDIQD